MDRDEVHRELDESFGRAIAEDPVDVEDLKLVVFSDQHRGVGNGADDFLRCERAYCAALAHYGELGHTLFLLGDVEELWECRATELQDRYPNVLSLEARFHEAGRLRRFWGNHDILWKRPGEFKRYFGRRFPGLEPIEALRWPLTSDGEGCGELLFTHGHQGTLSLMFIQMLAVRFPWRLLQNAFKFASATPAVDWALRDEHDVAMADWAAKSPRRLLVTGHTHRPVLAGARPSASVDGQPVTPRRVQDQVDRLAKAREIGDQATAAEAASELEYLRAEERRFDAQESAEDRPEAIMSYANTGCCSFGDGDITGLVFEDGTISLVRWPGKNGERAPLRLGDRLDLRSLLAGSIVPVRERV